MISKGKHTVFSSNRCLIRLLNISDLDNFHLMQGNPNVMRYTTGKANSLAEDKKDLESVIELYKDENPDLWVWAIETKEEKNFIGTVAFAKTRDQKIEIGIRFLEKFWRMGFGKEVLRELVKFGFKKFDKHELFAFVLSDNIGSIKMIESIGFSLVKTTFNTDLNSDEYIYSIKRS